MASVATAVADLVAQSLDGGSAVLVLGGDCTVGIGTVAGALASSTNVGLVYVDLDTDLNTPQTTTDGALDWMGVAHLLSLPGTVPAVAEMGPRTPLLLPDQVLLYGADNVTPAGGRSSRPGDQRGPTRGGGGSPTGTARAVAREWAQRFDRVLVHVDVDVLDYLDLPIAEETRRNRGLRFTQLVAALRELVAAPNWVGLTLCEVNPDHGEGDPRCADSTRAWPMPCRQRSRRHRVSDRPRRPALANGPIYCRTRAIPDSYAITTACTRSRRSSLSRICATWVLAVCSDTTSSAAISAFERPRAIRRRTSSSLGVSSCSAGGGAGGTGRRTARSAAW